ncbi:hypothetical protein LX70_03977 [Defluviimonas denitrificans]|uniref:Uncharacterized protein n=1 Tax=Albidovulum denitrificans TaxID=404881 RepID=A0A2S8RWD2_9RHOB|nr:hypothetical protein [Defluviimonas denitrificans]PQV52871.1 hypothetical protein LX70_03977 [Defluviimonas denitrificans]
MPIFPKTQAVQDALRIVTDPEFAQKVGQSVRNLAWLTLTSARGTTVSQIRPRRVTRPSTGGDAA